MFKQDKQYKGQAIRLLSCGTGKLDTGFAQNLANKLNVPVQAPTDILWATSRGTYYVTAGKTVNGRLVQDRSAPGTFRTFYPQGRKKK
ncbi:MAG: rhsG core protein with extension [bacterium]|nr:rhsG core protein with extension [bacterium]